MLKNASSRRLFCSFLFFTKVLIALSLSLGVLGYFTSLIYQRHISAVYEANLQRERDRLGLKPPVITFRPGQCNSVGNRVDAPPGSAYYGFSLNFAVDNVDRLVERLGGRSTAVINAFTTINTTWFDRDQINWWASSTGKYGGILELTVDPNEPVNNFQPGMFEDFAKHIAAMNSQYGVPIILRYGHEMNGYWRTFYGAKPIEYIASFRELANTLKVHTNMTAMLWNPNIGTGYPYSPQASQLPPPGSDNFNVLDTNNDGVINSSDDPYLPFYPGDDVVDWVGLSFYQYYINVLTDQEYFTKNLNPTSRNGLDAFYTRFSDARNKPMALGESGAPFIPTLPNNGVTELMVKQSWWQSMFEVGITSSASSPLYPNLKLFTHFEEEKMENFDDPNTGAAHSEVKDYRITFNDQVKEVFLQDYGNVDAFKWSNQLKYTCGGGVALK